MRLVRPDSHAAACRSGHILLVRGLFVLGLAMVAGRVDASTIPAQCLVSTFTCQTSGYVDVTITSTNTLADVYLVAESPATQDIVALTANLPGNTPTTFASIFLPQIEVGKPDYVTILGVYDVANGLVAVGFNPPGATTMIEDSTFFGVALPGSLTEAQLATALETGNTATIAAALMEISSTSFFSSPNDAAALNIPNFPASSVSASISLVDFSTASPGGTVNIQPAASAPLPEPGSIVLLATGLLGLGVARMRKQPSAQSRLD